ncbi:hypothetical protein ACLVWQ_06290 [Streptomyces sp. CWNU-52B]|uniref:hypothetical protein n=1 Tax=unclassified Streptomyces TaxID=2593676 RepID=UPI0039BF494F
MTPDIAHPSLTEGIARAVESVPGVAFLRPGLADRLRSTLARPQQGKDRASAAGAAGVRLIRPGGTERWQVEIHLVALRQARALDVARATRSSVEEYLITAFPTEPSPAHVTVTVTGQV